MKRKYTWSKVYGTKDPRKERIRESRAPKPSRKLDPPRVWNSMGLEHRPVDTIHYRDCRGMLTICGKRIHPKIDVSPTRRGIFFSNKPELVTCLLCKSKL